MAVLFHLKKEGSLWTGFRRHFNDSDDKTLQLLSRLTVGQERSGLHAILQKDIPVAWEETYDLINPFGDRRGAEYESTWTLDLDEDSLLLTKKDRLCSASLGLARERLLTLADFEALSTPKPLSLEEQTFTEPYWNPDLPLQPRTTSFLSQILRDFAHAWRHVLRRPMNNITFTKLAYATIWVSTMNFSVSERTEFDHSPGGPYVWLEDLPTWETPEATLFQVGQTWFVLTQDTRDGLEIVQRHIKSRSTPPGSSTMKDTHYAILTIRHIVLCKARGQDLEWTRPQTLFDGEHPPSDRALDMLLWAASGQLPPNLLNKLPTEVQDKILLFASRSPVSAAKLGCELGLGSSFAWFSRGVKIELEEVKRKRMRHSPVESQIYFGDVMSGVSYKPQRKPVVVNAAAPWPVGPETVVFQTN